MLLYEQLTEQKLTRRKFFSSNGFPCPRLLCMPLLLVLHAESLISISILWYRLKPLPGSSGINKSGGSSEPSTIGVRNMLASEQECGSLHRDHIAEQKVVVKGSNRSNNQEDFPASLMLIND
ncbi:hypothetical protein HN51_059608 [Arachis hypogaea]